MKTKNKNQLRIVWGLIALLACCISFFCFIGVFSPNIDSSPATEPTRSIETIVAGTSAAARVETLAIATPFPTLFAPPTQTAFILPASPIPQRADIITSIPKADCVPNTPPQTGIVVKVVDGDTIHVKLNSDGITYSVRYIGIDTPESTIQHEPFGKEASEKNAELVAGKTVTLFKDVSETDKYDRLLRYVFTDAVFVNYELVKLGYANAATYPPDVACADYFHEAESYARDLLLGLWTVQPAPTNVILPTSTTQTVIIIAVNKSAEYVDIKNIGSSSVNLNGWTLVSEKGNQRCALDGMLDSGVTLRIWAGVSSTGFSCGFGSNIWNNSEPDPAVLYDPQGREVDRY